MVRFKAMVTGCLLLACLVSAVVAQNQKPDQKPGQRPQGGGRGGFGGGGFGGPQSGAALLGIAEVQKELGISDEQKGKLEAVLNDLREQGRSGFNFQDFQSLKEDEREKKMAEFRKKAEELGKKATESVSKILDAKQNERFGQLQLQREGIAATAKEEVADKLKLSKEQREKLTKIQEEGRTAQRGGGNFGQLSEEERRAQFTKMQEARDKRTADMVAVLTADQKGSWEKMLGAKFDFPQPRGFGGGGGGGQGGGEKKRPTTKKAE
jgi:Spy/CpxP family protein refolding chaperone